MAKIQSGLGVDTSGKRMKEHVMKDVTNVLEAWPIKLKPTWSGLKSGSGSAIREAGPISK